MIMVDRKTWNITKIWSDSYDSDGNAGIGDWSLGSMTLHVDEKF